MEKLTLRFSLEQADDYCRMVRESTRLPAQALAALSAVQSFVAATADPGQQATPAYQELRRKIDEHLATARARVMEDNLALLIPALSEHNLCDILRVHASLSRNGFHQTVLAAIQRLSDMALLDAANRVAAWVRDARARAEAASGFPDALDLHGAGIVPELWAAMTELDLYLQEAACL